MTIGRSRSLDASSVASITPAPASTRSLANWMIKIAFLVVRPSVVSIPIWKYTSLGMKRRLEEITPLMIPSGSVSRIAIGIGQLSYSAARHRKVTKKEKAYSKVVCALAMRSW